MLVKIPLNIASAIIENVDHGISVIWKKIMVPISPKPQPIRHHIVFSADFFQVIGQDQKRLAVSDINYKSNHNFFGCLIPEILQAC